MSYDSWPAICLGEECPACGGELVLPVIDEVGGEVREMPCPICCDESEAEPVTPLEAAYEARQERKPASGLDMFKDGWNAALEQAVSAIQGQRYESDMTNRIRALKHKLVSS